MGSNPINLGFRFILEMAALVAFGRWGWNLTGGTLKYVLVIVIPLLAAVLWGTFAVPGDPSRSGNAPVPVAGWIRLVLELVFFALAVFLLFRGGNQTFAAVLGLAVAVHYLLSHDRITWLLQQTPK